MATASGLATIYVLSTLPTPLYVSYRQAFGSSQIVLTIVYAAYVVGALASLAIAALATVAFLCANGTAWPFVARVLTGLGIALASGAGMAWILELHPPRAQQRATQVAIGSNLPTFRHAPHAPGLAASRRRLSSASCHRRYS